MKIAETVNQGMGYACRQDRTAGDLGQDDPGQWISGFGLNRIHIMFDGKRLLKPGSGFKNLEYQSGFCWMKFIIDFRTSDQPALQQGKIIQGFVQAFFHFVWIEFLGIEKCKADGLRSGSGKNVINWAQRISIHYSFSNIYDPLNQP